MDKQQFINYLITGGLYLWDSECMMKWDNLNEQHKIDWNYIYDICQDCSTQYTEELFQAIHNGLCPIVETYLKQITNKKPGSIDWKTGNPPKWGIDYTTVKFWYFNIGPTFDGKTKLGINNNTVIEFPTCPCVEYYGRPPHWANGEIIININTSEKWEINMVKKSKSYRKIYAFTSIGEAWEFLFGMMIDKKKFELNVNI